MNSKPIHVSIVVFPECDPSIIYGVFDTLWAAGALVGQHQGRRPDALFEPRLVAADAGPMQLITGVSIIPQDTIDDVRADRHRLRAERDGRIAPRACARSTGGLIDWIRRMHAQGAQLYAACGGSLVLAEAGLLDGQAGDDALGLRAAVPRAFPERDAACRAHAGADRPRPQHGLLGRRVVMAGSRAAARRQARRHRGSDPHVEAVPLSVAPRRAASLCVDDRRTSTTATRVILHCQHWIAQHYERQDIVAELVRKSGLPKRIVRPPLPRRDRLFAARLYPDAAHRGGKATAGDQHGRGRAASGARSATRTRPRSAGCSAASPAWRRATTGANSSRRASWRRRESTRAPQGGARPDRDVHGVARATRARSSAAYSA